ncbi:hypothetical protein JCM10296v2_003167 [Rhodotorula toruloides]
MVSAALVHGTLVNSVSLQCATRVFTRTPSMSATLARLYNLSRAELSLQYSPNSLIDSEPFSVLVERLRAVQAEQRKAAVEEERRLVRSIICAKCAPKYAAEPGRRWHQLFPQGRGYGRGWKMLDWRQYRREKEMYEKCVRADEEGLPRTVDKYARRQEDEEQHEQPVVAGHAGGGVGGISASPRYPACACPRCVWQARTAIEELNRDTDDFNPEDFAARYGLGLEWHWGESGDLASVIRLYKESPRKEWEDEVQPEETRDEVGLVYQLCGSDMSVEVYSKPLNLQPVLNEWAKCAEEQPLKELCEDWDLVFGDKAGDEGADISPKVYVYAQQYNSPYYPLLSS